MDLTYSIEKMLKQAVDYGSSDIHILPEEDGYNIYFRHTNQLIKMQKVSESDGMRLIAYFKYLGNMDVGERRRPQSGASAFTIYDTVYNARFSTMATYQAQESLVIRLLSKLNQLAIDRQSFFKAQYYRIQKLVHYQSGLILFAGPVSSGKTTTMYHAITQQVEKFNKQVISIEDPVEIEEERFLQFQVNEAAGVSYDRLVRQSLRHHPDIMIIGEIRDEETATAAIRAALTGHLVLASVHAKNAEGVAQRLAELGIAQNLMLQTVIGIVFQKLLPRYCPFCRGVCKPLCSHFSASEKKAVLFDVRGPKEIKSILLPTEQSSQGFNHWLKKTYAAGYIDAATYTQYAIPEI